MALRGLNLTVVCTINLLIDHLYTCCYMLIAAKNKKEITTLKAQLCSKFEMKDLGAAKKILGMEITRDRNRSEERRVGKECRL